MKYLQTAIGAIAMALIGLAALLLWASAAVTRRRVEGGDMSRDSRRQKRAQLPALVRSAQEMRVRG